MALKNFSFIPFSHSGCVQMKSKIWRDKIEIKKESQKLMQRKSEKERIFLVLNLLRVKSYFSEPTNN